MTEKFYTTLLVFSFLAIIISPLLIKDMAIAIEETPKELPFKPAEKQQAPPFKPGEKLTFRLRWGFIIAGEASLMVLPNKKINDIEAYHFALTAKTNPFADVFYKVRDRIDAYADLNMTHSLLYEKEQREGSSERDITVTFDWDNRTAQYTNREDVRKPIKIKTGTFDPFSIFYYARFQEINESIIITRSVTDGKKKVIGQATVVKRETINVPAGTFDTYLIIPELKDIGGVFEKSPDATIKIWLTADERKIPVKLASKVIVGSFVGELVSSEQMPIETEKTE
ncbi:MAG: DUF3108 domain-containing protein [Desulfobacterales bacterium]|nr:DUF3108 domain-containing protein [Desulfobacterales bacterium]